MKNPPPEVTELARRVTEEFADKGLLIEAGWQAFKILVISKEAPPIQISEMHNAYFAGAQHLFGSMMSVLEPGEEPTEKDLNRITLISEELKRYVETLKARVDGKDGKNGSNGPRA